MEYQFTIIVPIYNEEENLERLEQQLSTYLEIAVKPTCILLVNDGSSDNSLSMIEKICAGNEAFYFISFAQNCGLSAAIKAGFDYANTPLIGYIDSDLQTDPEDFNLLMQDIGEYDLVTGWRADRKDSFVKNMSSLIANGIRKSFTHDGMNDTGCPLKIIKADYAKRIPMFKGLHRFLPAMIMLQNGSVKQVPVRHYPRIAGKAKFHVWNRLLGPFLDCFAYLWMKKKYINYNVAKKG
ncbi:MAG: dolichol-phosphate mannosyltransferase [Zunongwangia sp.]|uniref:Dolichol-phosphate mannosyltransferase n=1 Tax=Zunongwangia profunda TaxID=398743 RepID=A0A3D5IYE6_9FLAO|nr:glycosyltransferase [Zunongwangia profunda]MAC63415.1 dolichol-phosphate mannosyltransferase [Flavobacteriaceae bacterium]MAO35639.1 dolichol-phosphate mannosyltransferase [Zunongwangia sp.]MAG88080.1 dolichol-phosphate mannosyltransferase [Flavobacteriaceae bacterium]MAS69593.1 dolichol-phosphate mannosyltransferase [Zunongwangia sp.]HAJ82617.1 dolichol-phosphate mannosyltransferase [Zunongwangia profunda]|tara:strand:- start:1567 stop:2280 length:714 start_codon:yes stop_codon:yes gene_type:complete